MKKEFLKFPRHANVWADLPDGSVVPIGRRAGVRPRTQTCHLDVNSDEYKALVEKFGEDATKKMKEMGDQMEARLNAKYADFTKGGMKAEDFENFKKLELKDLNEKLAKMDEGLTEKLRLQGEEIGKLKASSGEGGAGVKEKSLQEYLKEQIPAIRKIRDAGAGHFEITSEDLIKAGVHNFGRKAASTTATSIGTAGGTNGSVIAMSGDALASPYLPGLGGSDLELFDIIYNPNFILNRVDVGVTNQSRLAWINEIEMQGTVDVNIAEGGAKPLIQHKFSVEYSIPKKAAAYFEMTEEFEDDLPGLATAVRRLLQADVLRAFDDQIQALVIAAARPYEITGLDGAVAFATLFDTIGALIAQIGFYNFVPNTVALNPVTNWLMLMGKNQDGSYLNPPFMDRLNRLIIEANKIAVGYGLAGDLTQYKVDIYKQFSIRVGWINDNFIKNKFCVLGEIRYHAYISDSRKKAIVYNSLTAIQAEITSGS